MKKFKQITSSLLLLVAINLGLPVKVRTYSDRDKHVIYQGFF